MVSPVVTITLIAITVAVSWWGFRDGRIVDSLIFSPESILHRGEGYRVLTSAFLQADWQHLLFNMIGLYCFGKNIELIHGPFVLLAVYFGSILGASGLSLCLHRHHHYLAYGASGGVSGIIFASIFLVGGDVSPFFMPVRLPIWLYGMLYLAGSYYGIRKGAGNIGHDAHLGGAVAGLLVSTAIYPRIIVLQPWIYGILFALSAAALYLVFRFPSFLPGGFETYFPERPKPRAKKPPGSEISQQDIDRVLDKISSSGLNSLTESDRKVLREASRGNPRDPSK